MLRTARSRRSTRTALSLAVALVAAGALGTGPASAATLAPGNSENQSQLTYTAAAGETNDLQVGAGPGGSIVFTDSSAPITSVGTCTRMSAQQARCPAAPSVGIDLGDRDDHLSFDAAVPVYVTGGSGNDQLTGGPGNDALWGGDGDDVLDGRGGADFISGQAGVDRVTYAARTAPVSVNLTELLLGTEGEAGERDTVASDVENVTGGQGADTLIGSEGPNQLDGGPGADVIDGRGGADSLQGGPGADAIHSRDGAADTVDCGGEGDQVDADPIDIVTNCETAAALSPTGTPGAGSPGGALSQLLGVVSLPSAPVRLSIAGRLNFTVTCPSDSSGGRCQGTIALERAARPSARRSGHLALAARRRHTRSQIGDQEYSILAGRSQRVSVRISSVERRRITRRGSDRVSVYSRSGTSAGSATKLGTVVAKAARRTHRHPASASNHDGA